MEQQLADRVALVTGAANGIGKACVQRLAAEGADVIVADIDRAAVAAVAAEIRSTGRRAMEVAVDVSNVAAIRTAVNAAVSEMGKIDILVNCAGVVQNKPLLDVTEEDWDRIIDINQKGTTFFIQAVAAHMVSRVPETVRGDGRSDRCYGKIVNFSSISGRRGREYQVHYAASKAAIISITQSAALAFAPYNINVNAVSPSVVMTGMWEQNDREKAAILGTPPGQASKDFIERIPLKRAGSPEDMAAAVAFLCSNDADYITGQTLNVDGGFEMD